MSISPGGPACSAVPVNRPSLAKKKSKQSAGTKQALSLLLSSRLAPTHPHLLVTYLRRCKAQAVCQAGNDISSGTAERTPDSCCGILRRMRCKSRAASPGPTYQLPSAPLASELLRVYVNQVSKAGKGCISLNKDWL